MPQPILIDSNLLTLLIVGNCDKSYISRHRRLTEYSEGDYELLVSIVAPASGFVFNPNVLTEASNLLRQIGDPIKSELSVALQALISAVPEAYIQSLAAAADPAFLRLGLTDSVLLTLANQNAILLTADLDLYVEAVTRNHTALNFNHLRDAQP